MNDVSKENKESKDERFRRIAEKRTNDILRKLRLLGNCANKSIYGYDVKDAEKIFNAIEEQLEMVKNKFKSGKNEKFKL